MSDDRILRKKTKELGDLLARMKNALVAFSGGCDSTLLAAAAHRARGASAAALTVRSPLSTRIDRADAERMARVIGIRHFYLDMDELAEPDITANGSRKCYYCKRLRFGKISAFAAERGYENILDGTNTDDLSDYRPGMEAMKEFANVSSPLLASGFSKADVRALSREWGLETWSKPAAACLASRVASPCLIDRRTLEMIDEGESRLLAFLPSDSQVRVRHHGEIARIEADAAAVKILMERSREAADALRTIGYRYVTLDLDGYTMGNLNPQTFPAAQSDGGTIK